MCSARPSGAIGARGCKYDAGYWDFEPNVAAGVPRYLEWTDRGLWHDVGSSEPCSELRLDVSASASVHELLRPNAAATGANPVSASPSSRRRYVALVSRSDVRAATPRETPYGTRHAPTTLGSSYCACAGSASALLSRRPPSAFRAGNGPPIPGRRGSAGEGRYVGSGGMARGRATQAAPSSLPAGNPVDHSHRAIHTSCG